MGLFSRSKDAPADQAATQPSAGNASFGHAAFDRADIEDARRGHPALSLEPFATASGLDYSNNEIHSTFISTLPLWPQYIFNICRGAFGARLGQVSHELLEMEATEGSIRGGGTFYDVRVTTRRSMRDMLNLGDGDPDNSPFAGNAVWIPTTTVHLRVPELNQLPTFWIRKDGTTLFGGRTLEQYGLPRFHIGPSLKVDDPYTGGFAPACQPLASRNDAYVRLQVKYGIVALTVNGYRSDEQDLQQLVNTASHVAHNLVALTQPATASFATPGPAVGNKPPAGVPLPHPHYTTAYATVASNLGMGQEDPHYLSHVLPRCPIPGVASGVIFGTLPGSATVGRMLWFEHGGAASGTVRGGVIVPATPGATTPLGGTAHEPTGTRVEIVDGIAYCWKIQRFSGRLESAQLTPDARAAFAATGAATI